MLSHGCDRTLNGWGRDLGIGTEQAALSSEHQDTLKSRREYMRNDGSPCEIRSLEVRPVFTEKWGTKPWSGAQRHGGRWLCSYVTWASHFPTVVS